ncbi:MAG: cytochrome c oxidase accessory protein CcoG [Bacteroidales bacterium]|nr:cytochrome c oxidase accessory protein CcoG [Bacteroidales bacterium]
MSEKNIEEIQKLREEEGKDPNYSGISYRDKISTIGTDGKRMYIHPKKPKGRFTTWRNIVGFFLLFLLIAFPIVKISGNPIVMLNFLERKFIIFGVVFWPQDTFIMMLMMVSFLVFILLFTATFGRLFCGWACPQTIFLELIFRPIEFWIDGDGNKQRKLAQEPWNGEKIRKRLLKWSIFYLISFILVNVILWYFMGFDKWLKYANELDQHLVGFTLILVFTTVFFLIYSWFREQICLIACPYGRMQGVLIDPSTIVISYDYLRGEPRGHLKKSEDREVAGKGDCIDCHACVDVCPTGIDIRNGTQLECVNCTACIDACDSVMDRIGKPRGLIRYASENEIKEGKKQKLSFRSKAYSLVLLIILSFFVYTLLTRESVDAVIIRTPNILFQEQPGDSIRNIYNIKAVNKTSKTQELSLKLLDVPGSIYIVGGNMSIEGEKRIQSIVFINVAKKDIKAARSKVEIGIFAEGRLIDKSTVTFLAP